MTKDKNDRFIQGYICAVCALIYMEGHITTAISELFRAGVGQMTLKALGQVGVPKQDLDTLKEHWNDLH